MCFPQRGLYPRQGQQIVDRVQRRYETDTTFRGIVDRYLSDFEKMLQDLSRNDPRGGTFKRGWLRTMGGSTSCSRISAAGSELRSDLPLMRKSRSILNF